MSTDATSRIRTANRVPGRSPTGNAGARSHARPPLHSSPHSSATGIFITAEPNPIGHTAGRKQLRETPNRRPHTLFPAIKSP
jgi:hypothetical protein